MRLPSFDRAWPIGGWTVSLMITPGWLAFGVYWENDPLHLSLHLPFIMLCLDRNADSTHWGRDWGWLLVRLIVGRQEIRCELDLNCWMIGMQLIETDDYSFHLGPIDIECEYDKFHWDDDFTIRVAGSTRVPVIRLFPKPRRCHQDRNDRDIWRMVEGNRSIAYEDEIIAYDILAAEKRRKAHDE